MLTDDRGPVVESIVARSLHKRKKSDVSCRMVGLSATLPNHADVAKFLRVDASNVFVFDTSHRPVPLKAEFIEVANVGREKRDNEMNRIIYNKLMDSDDKCQLLVFVHSRKETWVTANGIIRLSEEEKIDEFKAKTGAPNEILDEKAELAVDQALSRVLSNGVGIHHAGLCRSDRKMVEELFRNRKLKVIFKE